MMESRVVKLETTQQVHGERLDRLELAHKEEIKDLKESVDELKNILRSIKWLLIGGIAALSAKELGVLAVLKAVVPS